MNSLQAIRDQQVDASFTTPDAQVIAASVGDPEEFATIFHRHFRPVYGFLARRYGADAAADLSAETFLRAFRRRSSYRPQTPTARPWLFGIATRVAADRGRQEARQLRAYAAIEAQPRVNGEDPASAMPARQALVDALLRLQPGDRDALLLFAWGDLSYDEVADALGIPIGTVRSRIHRARQQLRDVLASEDTLLTDGGHSHVE